jgi:hypothetical protein
MTTRPMLFGNQRFHSLLIQEKRSSSYATLGRLTAFLKVAREDDTYLESSLHSPAEKK